MPETFTLQWIPRMPTAYNSTGQTASTTWASPAFGDLEGMLPNGAGGQGTIRLGGMRLAQTLLQAGAVDRDGAKDSPELG